MQWVLGSRGDTLVEVLVAITVISVVLGAAYVSSNKSQNGGRQAEERSEALKMAEGQLERIKALAKGPVTSPIYTTGGSFCIQAGTTTILPAGGPACIESSLGTPYRLSATRTASGSGYTFTVLAQWDRAGGGLERATLLYRAYAQ